MFVKQYNKSNMGDKNLAYSFEEIMAYHLDNITVYEEIKRNIYVLCPFIGAELT